MNERFLLDEHLPKWWLGFLRRKLPQVTINRIGVPGAAPLGSADEAILDWCERNDFLSLTNNRHSMAGHLAVRVANGRHLLGVLHVADDLGVSGLADQLTLIAGASFPREFEDQIRFLPF